MKIGDIIQVMGNPAWAPGAYGVVIGFVEHTHPRETQKVTVLSNGICVNWVVQYCQVVFEHRTNEP
jgi:hypothetical protein|tara:strand:+ start:306 stop:503 length:198 start_codon:yes stop_codon:yes gene_type:complete